MKRLVPFFLVTLFIGCGSQTRSSVTGGDWLHVPSPDWRDQVVYFLLTDRFDDGDPSNNRQGTVEYDPSRNSHYSGGDLQGVINRVDYIRRLGATAVWITPPVANQWWDSWNNYSGYHGYWAENFTNVDKHYGDLDTYRALSRELHRRGMYLIQDIVCNHTGNFFRYAGGYDPAQPEKFFELNGDSLPAPRPSQPPFDRNDVRDPAQREAEIYHWTPDINNYQDNHQLLTYQMSGLDDLNTANPEVRNALKDSFGYWIREAGVDGFRIDTVIYVEHDFWHDFVHSPDQRHPGVEVTARQWGKDGFLTFGETWVNVDAYRPDGDIRAASYTGTADKPEMTSVLNFPLHMELQYVFGEGKPTAQLAYRLSNTLKVHRNPHLLLNFADNHDMNRFLALFSRPALEQSLLFIMTIPGIPVIYYGTEQFFTESRASMFEKGYGSGGKDHFDTQSEGFALVSNLIALRKNHAVLRRGKLTVLAGNPACAGVLAYKMEYRGDIVFVLFNTSEDSVLAQDIATGLRPGTALELLFGLHKKDKDMTVGADGKITAVLSPRAGMVLRAGRKRERVSPPAGRIETDFRDGQTLSADYEITGTVAGVRSLRLVVDGNISSSLKVDTDEKGNWRAVLPAESLDNGIHSFSLFGRGEKFTDIIVSPAYRFRVEVPYRQIAEADDPVGDDRGPRGKYLYPTDPSFKRQMDIEKVTVYRAGGNIKVAIRMADEISTIWNPKFGFDHVTFHIYVDTPGVKGTKVLPFINATAPTGFEWDAVAVVGGWMSAMYSSEGSGKEKHGQPVSPAPKVIADKTNRTIEVIIYGKSLGDGEPLRGARLYITTWDYDGLESKYRPLQPQPGAYIFGGGKPDEPYVMDDISIIELQ